MKALVAAIEEWKKENKVVIQRNLDGSYTNHIEIGRGKRFGREPLLFLKVHTDTWKRTEIISVSLYGEERLNRKTNPGWKWTWQQTREATYQRPETIRENISPLIYGFVMETALPFMRREEEIHRTICGSDPIFCTDRPEGWESFIEKRLPQWRKIVGEKILMIIRLQRVLPILGEGRTPYYRLEGETYWLDEEDRPSKSEMIAIYKYIEGDEENLGGILPEFMLRLEGYMKRVLEIT